MSNQNDFGRVVSKELHIFYVLDTSGSMSGAPIAALNDAMRSTCKELESINKNNADAVLKIGVLEFNSLARWVTVNGNNEPIVQDLEDFYWCDLQAGGLTVLGEALRELNKQLSSDNLQHSPTGNKIPVIIFMSDGEPNDDWTKELDNLNQNDWYRQAIKIAFALGEKADTDILARVVGTSEAVIRTTNLESFKKMIRIVSVTSSRSASVSRLQDTPLTGAEVIKQAVGPAVSPDDCGVKVVPAEDGVDPENIYPTDNDRTPYEDIDFSDPKMFT